MQQLSLLGLFILFSITFVSCQQTQKTQANDDNKMETKSIPISNVVIPETVEPVEKTAEEWQAELNAIEYRVLREAGTERAFTGDLWDNKKEGIYTCRGCQLPLFLSDTKYKSGTGWPSFYQPIKEEFIAEKSDYKFGMKRTEVICARCDGHLGHVFSDGPKPTGLRYCLNSVSLDFVEAETEKKP